MNLILYISNIRYYILHRENIAKKIKQDFHPEVAPLTVFYWGGKILPDFIFQIISLNEKNKIIIYID